MPKRRRLNITRINRGSTSQLQTQAELPSPEGSSQPPEHGHSREAQEPSHSSATLNPIQHDRRVRGATRMADIWDLKEGGHIVVKVNDYNVPIDKESCALTRFIGTLVRMPSFAPICYTNWHDMPAFKREEMWETIQSKFEFRKNDSDEPVTEGALQEIKSWTMKNLGTKWRQWKNDLKSKFYDEHMTPEEMAAQVNDSRVNNEQFQLLAAHWCTGKAKEQSEQNRINRSMLDEPHCTGTKSFPRIIQTLTDEADGVKPSRAEVYIHTRTRKDGSIVNEKTAEIVDRMKTGLAETGSDNDHQQPWSDDVYSKVKGPEKKGRVRCLGSISTSSLQFVSNYSPSVQQNAQVQQLQTEVQELKDVLGNVLSLLQRQFPQENIDVLATASRMLNTQVPDAGSVPNVSARVRNHSSSCSHRLNENDSDATP